MGDEAAPAPPPAQAPLLQPEKNGIATAGLVCGILGIVLCWLPFVGLIAGLLGIIFGGIGMARAGSRAGKGRGAAIAGLVCGILAFVFTALAAAIAIPAFLDYMKKGKKTESSLMLRSIETKIKTYRIEKGQFPPSATLMPDEPTAGCMGGGKLQRKPQSTWDAAGWRDIGFHVDEDSRYAYRWTRESPSRGYAEALADLDCDGTVSITRVDFDVIEGNVVTRYHDPTPD
jgi:hypothetical protein